MARLLVGPLLRHTDETSATIWLEADRPCQVTVLAGHPSETTARTFTVHGHHYAVVEVSGLPPGSVTAYEVMLDEETVWPEPGQDTPPSQIRTPAAGEKVRLAFGSCRHLGPAEKYGHDALHAYARRLRRTVSQPAETWPTALLLVGDQVYADRPPEEARVGSTRDREQPPYDETADFEEYTELYRLAWTTDPMVRWLLSTVPTYMIFDDHDIRDDWNTSHAWRQEITSQPWWRDRIVGGLGSYWIYQHLGNLTAEERAEDPLYKALNNGQQDGGEVLDEYAERTDARPATIQWSYARDLGGTRLVVADSRCGRVLEPDRRAMLHEAAMTWLDQQIRGDADHVLIASSLPYLLPPAIHHGETWNEALCRGGWGKRLAKISERLRQGYDLEHWAAFEASFHRVADAVRATAQGRRGKKPASIAFLSGDVHFSYLARVRNTEIPVAQVVCSPLRNPLPRKIRWMTRLAASRIAPRPTRLLAALARVPKPPLDWRITHGLWFDNVIATVEIDGRAAIVRWEKAGAGDKLAELGSARLTP